MDGILNVNKPAGWTSHDVVAKVRRLAHQKRVGHAGTLDPLATGVLLVCLGVATRVVEDLMGSRKVYEATIVLGTTTTTDDAEGEVIRRGPISGITRDDVEHELPSFVGRILQAPPSYSAIKVGGRPLYVAARKGEVVAPAPREVEVFDIELLDWSPPEVRLRIACGKGTYIRSIARDLGERLGCGAHLGALSRTASGAFTLSSSVTLEEVEMASHDDRLPELLLPTDRALLHLDAVALSPEDARRMRQGATIRLDTPGTTRRRAYTGDGKLIGVLAAIGNDLWRAEKVLSATGDA